MHKEFSVMLYKCVGDGLVEWSKVFVSWHR